jgi:hypothetical protein
MTVSFKQFSTFIKRTEGELTQAQIDEAWADIFKRRAAEKDAKDSEDSEEGADKNKVMSAKDKLAQKAKDKKAEDEARRKELQKKRDQAWLDAKERAETRKPVSTTPTSNRNSRDEYQLHRGRMATEGKTSYSDEDYWKDGAKAKGYKIKKLSGNLNSGDQTWGAFDGDKKMGEFTEQEEGRGGWLMEKAPPSTMGGTFNKQPGFFMMSDTDKVLKMELGAAKAYLVKKVDGTDGATETNTRKARSMIEKASSVKKLAIDLSNFVLAHESTKNKVIH